ncbi:MAG: class I SAM-dependent methyltransferase [Deltaproteobacteria bacterium]|nr:class I SAM-dependent methyltransferase [Deltaproteobacteria bacterium]
MKEIKEKSQRELFSEKLTAILNMGAMNLAMGIGYRVGLFEVMDGFDSPRPAAAIAARAGLDQRYVAEWLGVMVTGGIIELVKSEAMDNLFFLPGAHADFLTRRSGNANLGVYTQEIPLLTKCGMDGVVDGFTTGDGVPFARYQNFQAFMAELSDAKHRQILVDKFLPSVAGGEVVKKLKQGIRVCDLGCSEGVALLLMAQAFPQSRFTGMDIDALAIEKANREVKRLQISNVRFVVTDAAALADGMEFCESFDYVTAFDSIHDQTRPLAALKSVYHILAPGGFFSMIDIAAETDVQANIGHPMGPFLYTVSLMHCMPVGLMDGGTGLGMMWGRTRAVELLCRAGFSKVSVEEIPEDSFNDHFLCRK